MVPNISPSRGELSNNAIISGEYVLPKKPMGSTCILIRPPKNLDNKMLCGGGHGTAMSVTSPIDRYSGGSTTKRWDRWAESVTDGHTNQQKEKQAERRTGRAVLGKKNITSGYKGSACTSHKPKKIGDNILVGGGGFGRALQK